MDVEVLRDKPIEVLSDLGSATDVGYTCEECSDRIPILTAQVFLMLAIQRSVWMTRKAHLWANPR